jgi:tetraacyldisaccharide 4'-kinase
LSIFAKIFLFPFVALYALVTAIRNYGYKKKIFKSVKFDAAVISVGNLTTGGTGKTPHTEYLIQLLKEENQIGVLSRGYKRKSNGFIEVQTNSTAETVGDEPLMYKWKNPEIKVAVCEERAIGIPQLIMTNDEPMVILLDDAFQHRAVKPGISILLTEYTNLDRKSVV